MRRLLILLQLLLILMNSAIITHAYPMSQETGGVQATILTRAKLRDGPGTEWAILGYVEPGETFRIDGRAPYEYLWVRGITADGRIGWIFGDLISAPVEALNALPMIWVDDPFTLSPPVALSTTESVLPTHASTGLAMISGISQTAHNIFRRGQEVGNRRNVFSKVGDSVTASPYFLYSIGWGTYNLRGYRNLQAAVDFFSTEVARDGNNSFSNPSLAAYNGITTAGILDPNNAWSQVCQSGESPLECEYRIVRPSVSLIMLGSNDVALLSPDDYRNNLSRILQITIDHGIIPVLSLIPNRQSYESNVTTFNQIIVEVASNSNIPLWNFPSALAGLENSGLGDGIHPSEPPGDFSAAVDFTPENLRYGYTMRNLTALQVLDAIWRRVIR